MLCWHANTYPHWGTGINYFFMTVHGAERLKEVRKRQRGNIGRWKQGKQTGVNDGLRREKKVRENER